jgi:flagellar hook-basal body complex protein FliE
MEGVSAVSAAKSSLSVLNSDGMAGVGSVGGSASAGGDFGQVMSQVVSDAVGTMETGEATAIQGMLGAAPASKVVESVMAAQRTLQSALAIRDKAVSAFQEITRMAI